MPLKTSTTGSYPPTFDPDLTFHMDSDEYELEIRKSIKRAVEDQLKLGIDILVDGQVRDDIVSLFAKHLPAFDEKQLPYRIVGKIHPLDEGITVHDYQHAADLIPENDKRPIKAHVTGPMTIARGSYLDTTAYESLDDENLIMDLAEAIGQEASFLVKAGAEIVQIDEPVLSKGVDLNLAFKAMEKIIEVGEIPFPALHACGNITGIFAAMVKDAPVKMISIEGEWLKDKSLNYVNENFLQDEGKVIGLGCIRVSDYKVERLLILQNFLDRMITKLGEDCIWAVMPNCGLRYMPRDVAYEKLSVMVQAARMV